MAKVQFKRIEDSADIDDVPVVDGQLIATKDGKIFIDYGETRSEISGAGGGSSAPIGTMTMFAGETIPEGWLLCDGTPISRTTYASLFSKIGTTYGSGDGSTTFNLPNFKGRVPVGVDSAQTEFDTLGETGGSKELQEHRHTMTASTQLASLTTGGTGTYIGAGTTNTSTAGTGNSGNLQPYMTTNIIIKALNVSSSSETIDSLPIGSILEYDGNTVPEGYSEVQDYSTSEIKTGEKWINGKPIYRKVIDFGSLPNDTSKSVATGLTINSNNCIVTKLYGIGSYSNGITFMLPFINVSSFEGSVSLNIDNDNNVVIGTRTDRSGMTGYVVIEYIKATD